MEGAEAKALHCACRCGESCAFPAAAFAVFPKAATQADMGTCVGIFLGDRKWSATRVFQFRRMQEPRLDLGTCARKGDSSVRGMGRCVGRNVQYYRAFVFVVLQF